MSTPATVVIHDHDRDYGFYVNLSGYIDDGLGLDLMKAVNALGVAESARQIIDGCQGHDCNAIQFDANSKTFVIHAYDNEPVEEAYFYEPLSRGERIYDAVKHDLMVEGEWYCYVLDVVNNELVIGLSSEHVRMNEALVQGLSGNDLAVFAQTLEEHDDGFAGYVESLKQASIIYEHLPIIQPRNRR